MEEKSYKRTVYHSRHPEASPLWRLLNNHYEGFEQCYEERFEKKYGFFRAVIGEVVRQYLTCGDLKNGFAGYAVVIVEMSICLPWHAIHTTPPLPNMKLLLVNDVQPKVFYPFFALTSSKYLLDPHTSIVPDRRQDVLSIYHSYATLSPSFC